MAGDALRERGWYLSAEGVLQCTQNGKNDVSSLIKVALDTDLRDISQGWLPEDINRGKAEYVEGPGVLQLQKIRNVSAPKDNEESQAAPRLMKLVLTDGQTNCTAVETETIKDIGLNTAPGSKIKLKVTTAVEHGFLLLNNKNTQLLGGRVDKLAEGWELKKKLAKQQRSTFGEGGPPLFVPFGKRIETNHYRNPPKRDNFKSLEANKGEKKGENEDEFEQQRKATIAEALQAKDDSSSKRFGGGQKQVNADHDIARITEMGFRAEEASAALKYSNGNVQQAIDSLLNNRRGPGGGRGGPSRQFSNESRDSDRGLGRGRRDRREDDDGPGRGRKGRDFDQGDESHGRPSGPATLFDFLETKIPVKESKDSKKDKDTKTEESVSSQTSSSDKIRSQDRDRQRNSSGPTQSDSWSQSSRRPQQQQQDIPPRFVNKKQEDQSRQGPLRENKFREDRPKTTPNDFKSSDRNYSDRNFNDRKFNDRNFNDRNYNDRNYNDRRYNDRNYNDRNYNDRNYNERNYNDRNYNDRNYNDRNYNERNNKERNFNDKNYYDKSYSDRNFSGRGDRKPDNQRENERRDNFRRDNRGGKDSQNTRDTRQNYDKQNDSYQKSSYNSKPSATSAKIDQLKEDKSNVGQGQNRNVDKSQPSQNQETSRNTSNNNSSQAPPPQKHNQQQGQDHRSGQDQSRPNQGDRNKSEKKTTLNKDAPPFEKNNQNYYNNTGPVFNSTANSQQIYVQETYSQANLSAANNFQPLSPHNYETSGSLVTYNADGSYVNPQMNMELQMSSGPQQYTQSPPDSTIYTLSQVQISFKQGDRVMAKYWEDGLFYEAVIESVWPNLPTCVVTFVEYGNSEEVLLSDIRPMISALMAGQPSPIAVPQPDLSVPPPQVYYSAPPPQMSPIDELSNAISSMEFRRGGSGPVYQRKQDNRAQQQFYQPPAQRR